MRSGVVFDIKRYSIHDGPGIRTTVFLKGCPLACWWCHNPESQSPELQLLYRVERCILCEQCMEACSQHAILAGQEGMLTDPAACVRCGVCARTCPADAREMVGRSMSVPEVMAQIERDLLFFEESGGGVTFSGGEPLLQAEFLLDLLVACGRLRIHRAVDTAGHVPSQDLLRVARETELFLYDVKLMDPERHRHFTGVPNDLILNNLQRLSQAGAGLIVRIPVIPGVNDDDDNIQETADFLGGLAGVRQVEILPFHRSARDKHHRFGMPYRLAADLQPDAERLQAIRALLKQAGLPVNGL